MTFRVSDSYQHLIEKAHWSHAHGRSVEHILPCDTDLARLYSYAFRTQTIGLFHATREVLSGRQQAHPNAPDLAEAERLLHHLETRAVDPIAQDFRALVSTLYFYDVWSRRLLDVLGNFLSHNHAPSIAELRQRFLSGIENVTTSNGIYITQDLHLPQQGAFVVPGLDISIVPIVYGDYHSWNTAFLLAGRPGVAVHWHHKGAEIHLGFSPTRGQTILGECYADVDEGYAMPIPPKTPHGFYNTSGHDHVLPFVFGSLKLSGWGIFFDVTPEPDSAPRHPAPLESAGMNHSVYLDRAIGKMQQDGRPGRVVLIPPEHAGSPEIGGLELAVNCAAPAGTDLRSRNYRIVSIRSGSGRVHMAGMESSVAAHDHFGVPANVDCRLTPNGSDPLVFLDSFIVPLDNANEASYTTTSAL